MRRNRYGELGSEFVVILYVKTLFRIVNVIKIELFIICVLKLQCSIFIIYYFLGGGGGNTFINFVSNIFVNLGEY